MKPGEMKHLAYIIIALSLLLPGVASAQYTFDILTHEALRVDHIGVSSRLITREGIGLINEALHGDVKAATVNYDSINARLDKYQNCFDIIDLIVKSGCTFVNVKNSVDDIRQRVGDMKDLLKDFTTTMTLRGNIKLADTLIINACYNCFDKVSGYGDEVWHSVLDLVQYATGLRRMKTSELMTVLNSLNGGLDDIRKCLDETYWYLNRYIIIRKYYWKEAIYSCKSRLAISDDAITRWINVIKRVHNKE